MAAVRLVLAWAFALVVATLQTRYLPGPFRGVLVLDVFLLIAVYYGLHRGPAVGMVVGCLTGLLQDAASGHLLGFHGLTRTVAGMFGSWMGGRLTLSDPVPQAIVLLLATLLDRGVQYVLGLMIGQGFGGVGLLALGGQCIVNAIAGAVLYQMLGGPKRGVLRRA